MQHFTPSMIAPPDLSGYAEAVIVLANLMDGAGHLNADSEERLALAVSIVAQNPDACLITSGWTNAPDCPIAIADAMRDAAVQEHGLPPHRVFSDASARDTVGDALFVKRNLVEPAGLRRLTVVTSSYHVPRAKRIFRFVFGTAYALDFVGTSIDHARDKARDELSSLAAFRATFAGIAPGDTEAIYRRLRRDHPYYNGTMYPPIASPQTAWTAPLVFQTGWKGVSSDLS